MQAPIAAAVSYGTGLEAILCMLTLNAEPSFDNVERSADLERAVERGLPRTVSRAVARLRTPKGDPWSFLFAKLAADGELGHDFETVMARVDASSPTELKLTMLGYDRLAARRDAAVYRAVAGGDRSAVAAFRSLAARDGREAEVGPLLGITAANLRRLVVDALTDLPLELYAGPGTAALLERDALETHSQLVDSVGIKGVIERITRGLMYMPEPGIFEVVLVPSLVRRPWPPRTPLEHNGREVIYYPCRLDAEPSLGMTAIYRALGDGTRLKIMRRLAAGQASVGQMSEELGLAKATVHEHLLGLRTAGLVRLRPGGFELVPELPDLNWMLKEFLGLEMRGQCETCGVQLEPDGVAYICSFECTYCESCASTHNHICPNCAGELVQRPRRLKNAKGAHRSGRAHATAGRSRDS
jgi:hypothetical protein